MVYENTLTGVEQITRFIEENKARLLGLRIREIYNLGGCQFYEYPLFLFMDDHVIRLFFCDQELDITIYEKSDFKKYVKGDIFRHPRENGDFQYLCSPYGIKQTYTVKQVKVHCSMRGKAKRIDELEVKMDKGTSLHIAECEHVPGADSFWLKEKYCDE